MSVNLEEKIKKENEQLQKSESLLEKTVKKAMNFGRKPKNTQKKTAPKTSRQEMPEEKEAAILKETVKKESSKEESKKKSQPAKRSSNAKKAAGQKTKDQAAPKQTAAKKTPAKSQPTGEKTKSTAKSQTGTRTKKSTSKGARRQPVRIISLGGLGEIGKNVTVYESGSDMFVVDCGLAFPEADMPGVDSVIPDFTYLVKNKDKLRGVVITHGHEDHIGSLPYLLKEVNGAAVRHPADFGPGRGQTERARSFIPGKAQRDFTWRHGENGLYVGRSNPRESFHSGRGGFCRSYACRGDCPHRRL